MKLSLKPHHLKRYKDIALFGKILAEFKSSSLQELDYQREVSKQPDRTGE
jgi:hypothetical protein